MVNISSIGGRCVTPYQASKFALEATSDAMRMELAPQGIAVVLVEPGAIATQMLDWRTTDMAAVSAAFTPEHRRLYGPSVDALNATFAKTAKSAMPPDVAARVLLRALTARRPRTRYLIGRDARLISAAKSMLSDRAFDRLVLSAMGMSKLKRA